MKINFRLVIAIAVFVAGSNFIVMAQTNTSKQIDTTDVAKRLKIEQIPATNILYLPVSGNFDKHPQVLGQLVNYAQRNYAFVGACFGIYPVDPDTVDVPFAKVQQTVSQQPNPNNEKNLVWGVAVRVIPGKAGMVNQQTDNSDQFYIADVKAGAKKNLSKLSKAASPFELKHLPATMAVVLLTDVIRSPVDGLALNAWMVENGYLQTAPTRMELGMNSKDPAKVQTKIIIPVRKRNSGLGQK